MNITDVGLLIPLITGAAETALDRQRLQELLLEVCLYFSFLFVLYLIIILGCNGEFARFTEDR